MEAAREVQSEGPPLGSEVAGLRLSMGFQLDSESRRMLTPDSFGHYGFGGSVGIADPGLTVGFGYVPNQLRGGMGGDIRPRRLMEEVGRLLDERRPGRSVHLIVDVREHHVQPLPAILAVIGHDVARLRRVVVGPGAEQVGSAPAVDAGDDRFRCHAGLNLFLIDRSASPRPGVRRMIRR